MRTVESALTAPEPIGLSPADATKFLGGISRATLYRNKGRLDFRKIGRRTVITVESLRRLLADAPSAN